jgi:hypothetical protein
MEKLDLMETLVGGGQVVRLGQLEGMVLLVRGEDSEIVDQLEEPAILDQQVFKVIYLKRLLQIQ